MDTKLTKDQKKEFRKELPDGSVLVAHARFDDSCGNGHNSFSLTLDHYDRDPTAGEASVVNSAGRRRWLGSCGCQHDLLEEHFPELAPMVKWHLSSTDGPTHYIANTMFWAQEAQSGREPKGLEYARRSAVAPDASLAQLRTRAFLEERLPALLGEFRRDIERMGFTW